MPPVRRSRSLSYLPGRYLSRSPVLISQAAHPIVIKGELDRHCSSAKLSAVGRRPDHRPDPRRNLLNCYFQQDDTVIYQRLQNEFCEESPKTISEVLLEDQHVPPESDVQIASDLMREMIAEVSKTDRQLGRIATLVWRSYESCYDRIVAGAADAEKFRSQLDTTRAELRQARLKIAEQDGIIRFLNERRMPS